MLTGFNTDVQHEGHLYHVQTEDRGRDTPVLESIVYIGGTVIARKQTPYGDKLGQGASEEMIASLLKRQHQVIIAAIKAGRINDLVELSAKEQHADDKAAPANLPVSTTQSRNVGKTKTGDLGVPTLETKNARPSVPLTGEQAKPTLSDIANANATTPPKKRGDTKSLDLDQVIADYLKKNEEQVKLDLKVLAPDAFIAGKSIGLRVRVSSAARVVADTVVTVKVIGTAFKPQVFIGRAGKDGIANFSINLPQFSSGTAAIVIEAQAGEGRGELKHLIRRA